MVYNFLKINFSSQELWLLTEKCIWWPKTSSLIVSDLHLGKGISFTSRNVYLPPYDIQETLGKLKILVDKLEPQRVICLGDNFHRSNSYSNFEEQEKDLIASLIKSVPRWCWIYGNHDYELPAGLEGEKLRFIKEKTIEFHHSLDNYTEGNAFIIGHYHPKYTLNLKKTVIRKPCFAWNKNILIMPSFGTYTGGLDVHHSAITHILGQRFSIAVADTNPVPIQFYLDLS
ncbi:ligase-associated DNA damage response endonuclease PdeM [Candidatus Paracaedibacter symbiosus]|uniref:ligase-associated DNA damage response endonuclease PdeM n=1 Tax=Candidatus Paracaedibacter symbiosus TaxID=244582 RepID=UPI000691AC95|nr:ligase-associated DNA damage response endonuclease PdeM [Candidatus Paracaedibacter symbiosus]